MRVREKLVYKRQCFGGKGVLARGADRLFLGTLGAAGLAILPGNSNFKWILAILGGTALLALLTILDARRFERYWKKLIVQTETRLRRLAFLRQGGEGQPPPGEIPILSLEPLSAEELSARCLSTGAGVVLRLYQQEDPSLTLAAAELGCRLHFFPEIVDAIPLGVRLGIGPAIGLMLMNIGLGSNVGIYAEGNGYTSPFYVLRDFFGAMTPSVIKDHMGAEYSTMVLTVITMFIGLFVIILLAKKGVKAAVLVGMLVASVIYWAGSFIFLKVNPFASLEGASFLPPFQDMVSTTLFKFDFSDFFRIGWFTAISLIITFCMIDMFDTIGTLVGTASRAGMTDKNGNMPKMKEALLSDAVGTVAGACCGTSTVTTFVESASGVEAGGRTGLTSLTSAVMFLACMFIAPVAAIIPAAATSSALIYVGILMLQGLKNVDFDDLDQVVPVFIMLLAMPISGSIGHGIGLAMISYTVIKVFSGKAKDVSALTYVITALFLVKFFAVV